MEEEDRSVVGLVKGWEQDTAQEKEETRQWKDLQ